MLEIEWSSAVTKDPLILADAIELAVAFGDESYGGQFTQADFQHLTATENLGDDESPIPGDEADERVEQFEQALTLIGNRARWLGTTYPFNVVEQEVRLTPHRNLRRCLCYLFLLVCSNGISVPSLKRALPVQFEDLCKEAFRALFPEWAEVLSFSQYSEDRKTVFGYSAKRAVPKLADKLNASLKNEEGIPDTQREFGIDIIAICPFGDQTPYPFFAFAQCTIQEEWWDKRQEAKASSALTGFIDLNACHSNFLMIPHFPRYNLDDWSEDPSRTGDCIICDRFRICRLLERSSFFEHDALPERIDEAFQTLEANLTQPLGWQRE